MKKLGFRLVLTAAFIVLSVYLLYPTFKDYQYTKTMNAMVEKKKNDLKANAKFSPAQQDSILASFEDSIKVNNTDYKKARADRMKLGLDLQGGMRLVLEVNTGKLLEKLAQRKDSTFTRMLNESVSEANISNTPILDLLLQKLKQHNISVKTYFGSVREDEDKVVTDLKKQTEDAVTRAAEIIRNRIDQYGVSEPSIQRQGDRRVIVELPGVAKEEEARQLLQGTALLEFKLLKEGPFMEATLKKIDNALMGVVDSSLTSAKDSLTAKADTGKKAKENVKTGPFTSLLIGGGGSILVLPENKDKIKRMLDRPEVRAITENSCDIVFSARTNSYPVDQTKKIAAFELYFVNAKPEITGNVVTNANATLDQNSQNVVNMEMNTDGSNEWARITGANINKRCAIILDNSVFSAPVIRNRITGGRSVIEGMANFDEAKRLEIVLKAGALPAPVDIIEQRTIGPSLGADSVSQGTNSMLFGYLLIGFFMIMYYQRSGGVATYGLAMTILFTLGVLAGFKATLTLPGIAGIVLTMGMAVDANVLIFERIREELASGKTLRASFDSGFTRAYSAIIDSNIVTLITGVILYQFGTGPVQGFALTLMIGIITSLFSALVISRLVFDWMINKGYKITIG